MIDAKIIIFFEFRPHIQPSSQKFLPIASPLFYLNIQISQVPTGGRLLWWSGVETKPFLCNHTPLILPWENTFEAVTYLPYNKVRYFATSAKPTFTAKGESRINTYFIPRRCISRIMPK